MDGAREETIQIKGVEDTRRETKTCAQSCKIQFQSCLSVYPAQECLCVCLCVYVGVCVCGLCMCVVRARACVCVIN